MCLCLRTQVGRNIRILVVNYKYFDGDCMVCRAPPHRRSYKQHTVTVYAALRAYVNAGVANYDLPDFASNPFCEYR
jgi:hypothetical protein